MKRLLILFAAILMASTGMWAQETQNVSYSYPVYNTADDPASGIKEWKTASVDAIVVTDASEPVTWNAGWYVVTGTNVTLSKGAICAGDVRLILADGVKLTATGWLDEEAEIGWPSYAGIQVSGDGNSLTIYGQTVQTGQLEANGGDGAAGIGGKNEDAGSNITINGGMVTANSPNAAGIGGGDGGAGFNITINGGMITATGSMGAGIGGGYLGDGTNITINGGMITATSYMGAGIGNGYKASTLASNIKVATNLVVKAGNSENPTEEIATDRLDETDIASNLAGKKYVTIETAPVRVTYIDENGKAREVVATEVWSSITPATLGEANKTTWYAVTHADVQLFSPVCQGDVRLILADGAKLIATGYWDDDEHMGYTGIQVSGDGNSLTIYGQAAQSGQLIANGGKWAAGIGGGYGSVGSNITINGGKVTANGGEDGAGIGGGRKGNGSYITINGGMVTANGGNLAAGIGGGREADGTYITINGGTVTANGGQNAAGIGGGYWAIASNITINDGTVTASGGDGASGIGGGLKGFCNNIFVATTLGVKAGSDNPPITEINNDGDDIDRKLNGKRYATITSLQPIKDAAIDAIDAAFKDVTNENVKYFATTAKTSIEAATSEKAINSIKEKALADLQNALAIYEVGKTDAFGPLGTKQNGPAIIVTDQDDKQIILYSPKKVQYVKVNDK